MRIFIYPSYLNPALKNGFFAIINLIFNRAVNNELFLRNEKTKIIKFLYIEFYCWGAIKKCKNCG